MKTSTLILAVLLIASGAFAQPSPAPDFSRPTLLRVLAETTSDAQEPPIRFGGGVVAFEGFGTRWAFLYYPVLPLAGSRPVVSQVWPDAFSLTGTDLATPPRHYRDFRPQNEELLRIQRIDRSRVRVTVKPPSQ